MISKIVVGVDFSDASRRALEHGAEWARMLDVPLLAVHVLSVPVPSPMGMEVPSIPPESGWFEGLEEDASKRLQDWVKGFPKAVGQVCWGAASAKLLEYADRTRFWWWREKATPPLNTCSSAVQRIRWSVMPPAMFWWCIRKPAHA